MLRSRTLGVVLAGGLSRRMGGGDKSLLPLGQDTMLHAVLRRLRPQVSGAVLNANGDPARFAGYGLPVVADGLPGHPGPLAGVLAGLDHAALHLPGMEWVLSVPGDAPFLPLDLAERLHAARQAGGAALASAASGGRVHFAVTLWPVELRHALRQALAAGVRKMEHVTAAHGAVAVAWPTAPHDPFLNVNTPADLEEARRLDVGGGAAQ